MMDSIQDPNNIIGLNKLVNPENVKRGINLQQLENEFTKKDSTGKSSDKYVDAYKQELDDIVADLGFSFTEGGGGGGTNTNTFPEPERQRSPRAEFQRTPGFTINTFNSGGNGGGNRAGTIRNGGGGSDSDSHSNDSGDESDVSRSSLGSRSSRASRYSSHPRQSVNNQNLFGNHQSSNLARHSINSNPIPPATPWINSYENVPEVQQSERAQYRDHISNVTSRMNNGGMGGGMGGGNTGRGQLNEEPAYISEARRREWRVTKLAENVDLRNILITEGEDVSHIAVTDSNSTDEVISDVNITLIFMNSRNQDRTLFEEGLIAAIHGLEGICNGKREIFGIKPDLVDFHHDVALRLRKNKYDSAEFVHVLAKEYGIGNMTRFAFGLVLGGILHHKNRVSMKSQGNVKLITHKNATEAMSKG